MARLSGRGCGGATKRSRSSRFKILPIALRGSSSTSCRKAIRCVLPSRSLAQARNGLGVERRAFARDDPRGRRLAPALGRHAGDRRLGDVGVLAQHRLEVARIEVEAAADDHVLAAVDQRQKAVVVEAADVAGADEALAGWRRTTRPRRSSRAGRDSRSSSRPSGRRPRRSRRAAARGRPRRSGGCRGLRPAGRRCAAWLGCSCAARMQVPPPSVMP